MMSKTPPRPSHRGHRQSRPMQTTFRKCKEVGPKLAGGDGADAFANDPAAWVAADTLDQKDDIIQGRFLKQTGMSSSQPLEHLSPKTLTFFFLINFVLHVMSLLGTFLSLYIHYAHYQDSTRGSLASFPFSTSPTGSPTQFFEESAQPDQMFPLSLHAKPITHVQEHQRDTVAVGPPPSTPTTSSQRTLDPSQKSSRVSATAPTVARLNRHFDFNVDDLPMDVSNPTQDTGLLVHAINYNDFPTPFTRFLSDWSTKVTWSLSVLNRGLAQQQGDIKQGFDAKSAFLFVVENVTEVQESYGRTEIVVGYADFLHHITALLVPFDAHAELKCREEALASAEEAAILIEKHLLQQIPIFSIDVAAAHKPIGYIGPRLSHVPPESPAALRQGQASLSYSQSVEFTHSPYRQPVQSQAEELAGDLCLSSALSSSYGAAASDHRAHLAALSRAIGCFPLLVTRFSRAEAHLIVAEAAAGACRTKVEAPVLLSYLNVEAFSPSDAFQLGRAFAAARNAAWASNCSYWSEVVDGIITRTVSLTTVTPGWDKVSDVPALTLATCGDRPKLQGMERHHLAMGLQHGCAVADWRLSPQEGRAVMQKQFRASPAEALQAKGMGYWLKVVHLKQLLLAAPLDAKAWILYMDDDVVMPRTANRTLVEVVSKLEVQFPEKAIVLFEDAYNVLRNDKLNQQQCASVCHTNTGIMFVRRSQEALQLLTLWLQEGAKRPHTWMQGQPSTYHEQEVLDGLLLMTSNTGVTKAERGTADLFQQKFAVLHERELFPSGINTAPRPYYNKLLEPLVKPDHSAALTGDVLVHCYSMGELKDRCLLEALNGIFPPLSISQSQFYSSYRCLGDPVSGNSTRAKCVFHNVCRGEGEELRYFVDPDTPAASDHPRFFEPLAFSRALQGEEAIFSDADVVVLTGFSPSPLTSVSLSSWFHDAALTAYHLQREFGFEPLLRDVLVLSRQSERLKRSEPQHDWSKLLWGKIISKYPVAFTTLQTQRRGVCYRNLILDFGLESTDAVERDFYAYARMYQAKDVWAGHAPPKHSVPRRVVVFAVAKGSFIHDFDGLTSHLGSLSLLQDVSFVLWDPPRTSEDLSAKLQFLSQVAVFVSTPAFSFIIPFLNENALAVILEEEACYQGNEHEMRLARIPRPHFQKGRKYFPTKACYLELQHGANLVRVDRKELLHILLRAFSTPQLSRTPPQHQSLLNMQFRWSSTQVVLINLKRRPERLQHMLELTRPLSMLDRVQVFEGIDWTIEGPAKREQYAREELGVDLTKLALPKLGLPSFGCPCTLLSHLSVWIDFLERSEAQFLLVLEDDLFMPTGVEATKAALWELDGTEFDIAWLEHHETSLLNLKETALNRFMRVEAQAGDSLWGLGIYSREAVRRLLTLFRNGLHMEQASTQLVSLISFPPIFEEGLTNFHGRNSNATRLHKILDALQSDPVILPTSEALAGALSSEWGMISAKDQHLFEKTITTNWPAAAVVFDRHLRRNDSTVFGLEEFRWSSTQVVLISSTRNTERQQNMLKRIRQLPMLGQTQLFEALDGEQLGKEGLRKYAVERLLVNKTVIPLPHYGKPLSASALLLSHLSVWDDFLERSEAHFLLVLEDDLFMPAGVEDAKAALWELEGAEFDIAWLQHQLANLTVTGQGTGRFLKAEPEPGDSIWGLGIYSWEVVRRLLAAARAAPTQSCHFYGEHPTLRTLKSFISFPPVFEQDASDLTKRNAQAAPLLSQMLDALQRDPAVLPTSDALARALSSEWGMISAIDQQLFEEAFKSDWPAAAVVFDLLLRRTDSAVFGLEQFRWSSTQVALINLKRRPERLQHMLELTRQLPMLDRVQVFQALDGEVLGEGGLRKYAAEQLNIDKEVIPATEHYGKPLSTAGTLLSHLSVWVDFLERSEAQFLLVLEDDLFMPAGVEDTKAALWELEGVEFDIVWLEYFEPNSTLTNGRGRFLEVEAETEHAFIWGLGASIFSREAVGRLVAAVRRDPAHAADVYAMKELVQDKFYVRTSRPLRACIAQPAVFQQDYLLFESDNRLFNTVMLLVDILNDAMTEADQTLALEQYLRIVMQGRHEIDQNHKGGDVKESDMETGLLRVLSISFETVWKLGATSKETISQMISLMRLDDLTESQMSTLTMHLDPQAAQLLQSARANLSKQDSASASEDLSNHSRPNVAEQVGGFDPYFTGVLRVLSICCETVWKLGSTSKETISQMINLMRLGDLTEPQMSNLDPKAVTEDLSHHSRPNVAEFRWSSTQVVLINLKRRPERLQHMLELTRQLPMLDRVKVFEAIDGKLLGEDGLRKYAAEQLSIDKEVIPATDRDGRPLSIAGTLLSHLSVWVDFLERSEAQFLLVLEDDLFMPAGVEDTKAALWELEGVEFDIAWLEHHFATATSHGSGRYKRVDPNGGHIFGTSASVFSREAVRRLVAAVRDEPNIAADHYEQRLRMVSSSKRPLVALISQPAVLHQDFWKFESDNRESLFSVVDMLLLQLDDPSLDADTLSSLLHQLACELKSLPAQDAMIIEKWIELLYPSAYNEVFPVLSQPVVFDSTDLLRTTPIWVAESGCVTCYGILPLIHQRTTNLQYLSHFHLEWNGTRPIVPRSVHTHPLTEICVLTRGSLHYTVGKSFAQLTDIERHAPSIVINPSGMPHTSRPFPGVNATEHCLHLVFHGAPTSHGQLNVRDQPDQHDLEAIHYTLAANSSQREPAGFGELFVDRFLIDHPVDGGFVTVKAVNMGEHVRPLVPPDVLRRHLHDMWLVVMNGEVLYESSKDDITVLTEGQVAFVPAWQWHLFYCEQACQYVILELEKANEDEFVDGKMVEAGVGWASNEDGIKESVAFSTPQPPKQDDLHTTFATVPSVFASSPSPEAGAKQVKYSFVDGKMVENGVGWACDEDGTIKGTAPISGSSDSSVLEEWERDQEYYDTGIWGPVPYAHSLFARETIEEQRRFENTEPWKLGLPLPLDKKASFLFGPYLRTHAANLVPLARRLIPADCEDLSLFGTRVIETYPGHQHLLHSDREQSDCQPGYGISFWMGLENVSETTTISILPRSGRRYRERCTANFKQGCDVPAEESLRTGPVRDGELMAWTDSTWHESRNMDIHGRAALLVQFNCPSRCSGPIRYPVFSSGEEKLGEVWAPDLRVEDLLSERARRPLSSVPAGTLQALDLPWIRNSSIVHSVTEVERDSVSLPPPSQPVLSQSVVVDSTDLLRTTPIVVGESGSTNCYGTPSLKNQKTSNLQYLSYFRLEWNGAHPIEPHHVHVHPLTEICLLTQGSLHYTVGTSLASLTAMDRHAPSIVIHPSGTAHTARPFPGVNATEHCLKLVFHGAPTSQLDVRDRPDQHDLEAVHYLLAANWSSQVEPAGFGELFVDRFLIDHPVDGGFVTVKAVNMGEHVRPLVPPDVLRRHLHDVWLVVMNGEVLYESSKDDITVLTESQVAFVPAWQWHLFYCEKACKYVTIELEKSTAI